VYEEEHAATLLGISRELDGIGLACEHEAPRIFYHILKPTPTTGVIASTND